MIARLIKANLSWPLGLVLGVFLMVATAPGAFAQSVVVLVNDEPITTYDVTQRQRFLAMTSGLGDKMRAKLQSDETKEAFRAYMTEQQPQSREEAQELQKKFVAKIQQQVVNSSSNAMRKQAIDQLIDEKLMLQAARDQKIDITDDEVNQTLTRMAEGGGKKNTLDEFLGQFKSQGINPMTLRERIRAQSAWREVVRRVYGSRVRSAAPSNVTDVASGSGTVVNVEIVKLSVADKGDQKAVARRVVEAEQIRKQFSNCGALPGILKNVKDAKVQSVKEAKINDFRGDVRAALEKAKPGEMTPPIIAAGVVETHAVCTKKVSVASGKNEKQTAERDLVQEEFQLYSRRHLRDLKDRALVKYVQNG